MSEPRWVHMTQVLSSDGSAINNVIREVTREGAKSGIESAVLGSDNRDYHFLHARLLPVKMPSHYREHDILVVPSQFQEPFGLVLLEGMAAGLAVVCSGRGGMRQVGADAVQYASTPDQLAQGLDELLGNRASRQEWGRRARERAEQLSWQFSFMAVRHVVETTL